MSSPTALTPDDTRAFAVLRQREWAHLLVGTGFWAGSAGLLTAVFAYLPQPVLMAALVVPVLGWWFWRRYLPVRARIAAAYRDLAGRPLGLRAGAPVSERVEGMALMPVFALGGEAFHHLRWCLRGTLAGRPVAICNLRLGERLGNRTSGPVENLRFDGLVIEVGLPAAPPHLVLADPALTPSPGALVHARLGPPAGVVVTPEGPLRLWHDEGGSSAGAQRLGQRVLAAAQALDPAREALIGLDTGRFTLSVFIAVKGDQFLLGAEMHSGARALDNLIQSRAALERLMGLTGKIIAALEAQ